VQIIGIIASAIAGAAMSIQGVFNARLADKIGLFESNAFVQGTAFVLSLLVMWWFGDGSLNKLGETNKLYWLGGVIGVIITVTVMIGMQHMSPVVTVSVILVAQLLVAALIDAFGLFGTERMAFGWQKFAGLGLMLSGIILFKLKG
jgi:transporter family-2 protein